MSALGLLGIILMIAANELTFNRQDNRDSVASWFIKLMISISTAILLALVLYYHRLDLKLYCAQNALHDWRVGLTVKKIFFIVSELIICAIHPMPRAYPSADDFPIIGDKPPLEYTSVDVALGFPSKSFCFSVYLVANQESWYVCFYCSVSSFVSVGRTILFHSKLVREASVQSLGYLNHVAINFFF